MLKGRKQKYSERWPNKIRKAHGAPVLSTPKGKILRELSAEIHREHRTRKGEPHE